MRLNSLAWCIDTEKFSLNYINIFFYCISRILSKRIFSHRAHCERVRQQPKNNQIFVERRNLLSMLIALSLTLDYFILAASDLLFFICLICYNGSRRFFFSAKMLNVKWKAILNNRVYEHAIKQFIRKKKKVVHAQTAWYL